MIDVERAVTHDGVAMIVSLSEIYQALAGEADEEVRQRVLQAIEDQDPVVCQIIEARRQRAMGWLRLTGVPATEADQRTRNKVEG